MSTTEIDIPVPPVEVVAEPAPREHNAADLLFWPYAWSTDEKDGEVDFCYNSHKRVNRKDFKEPRLFHEHSTDAWKKKINNGL